MEMQPWTTPLCTCCFYSLQSSEEKLETSVLPYKANWGTSLGRRGCDSGKPARGLKEGLCASVVQIFTHTHTYTPHTQEQCSGLGKKTGFLYLYRIPLHTHTQALQMLSVFREFFSSKFTEPGFIIANRSMAGVYSHYLKKKKVWGLPWWFSA